MFSYSKLWKSVEIIQFDYWAKCVNKSSDTSNDLTAADEVQKKNTLAKGGNQKNKETPHKTKQTATPPLKSTRPKLHTI